MIPTTLFSCLNLQNNVNLHLLYCWSDVQIEGPITNVGVSIHLGYKQKLKIQNKPNFGFLFNRAKHASQKFGFSLTETEI